MTNSPTPMTQLAAQWRKPRPTPLYTLWVILLALVAVLLPLIYLALIGAAGYGLFRYCTEVLPEITGAGGTNLTRGGARALVFKVIIGVIPAVVGVAVVLFMLKPLLAPRREREDTIELFRSEEPRLYQFVEAVCAVIGAPAPARIDVTCEPNAAAGFRGGLLSLFTRGDLVLTLGMPLITGMTSGQLAGVIAHELGHFSQGTAMRADSLTRIVGQWLWRAAYVRDGWDAWLDDQLEESPHALISILLYTVKFSIFLTRLVLKALFYVGVLASLAMTRQMEYDADRYEYRFVGSEVFAQICERLEALAAGFPRAERVALEMWKDGRQVPDDMPALIADAALRITPEERSTMARARRTERHGFFLTHPPMRARLARAAKAAEPGIYHNTEPAATLCTDASIACRRVTYGLFKERLGGYLREATFVPVAKVLAPRSADHARKSLAEKYLGFEPPTWRPVWLSMTHLPKDVELRATVERLKKALAAVREAGPPAHKAAGVYREAEERRLRCAQAASLLEARLPVDWGRLELNRASRSELGHWAQDAQNRAAEASSAIDHGLDAAAMRLGAALRLLATPGIEKYVDSVEARRARVNELLPVMAALKGVFSLAAEVHEGMGKVGVLVGAIRSEEAFIAARNTLRPLSDTIRANVMQARQECGGVHYPFRSKEDPQDRGDWEAQSLAGIATNLGERIAPHTPGHREYNDIFEAGALFTDRFVEELGRTTGELVEIATLVEDGLKKASAAKKAPSPG